MSISDHITTSENADSPASVSSARQKRGVMITVVVLVVFMLVVLAGFINKITTPRMLNSMELRANGAYLFDQPRIFKDFQLTDHRGQPFSLAQLKGKWTLMFFGFTHCPDVCPTTLATLGKWMKQLDDAVLADTQVVLVTLDPTRDTVEKLAEYVPYFNPGFIGLTGDFLEIKRLANQLNIAFAKVVTDAESNSYSVDHSANLVLINPYGHYHGFFKPPLESARLRLTYLSMRNQF